MKQYITAKRIIDGNGNIVEDKFLCIEDGKIIGIVEENQVDRNFCDDYGDATILPGMMNAHVHMFAPVGLSLAEEAALTSVDEVLIARQNAEDLLRSGVTYIRNVGTKDYLDMELDKAIKEGRCMGPHFVTSGPVICMTGGHGWKEGYESDGEDECRKNTRKLLRNGVGLVKVMATGGVMTEGVEPGSPQLTEDEMRACAQEAHNAGRKTATHAQGTVGIKNAIRAGIDSIEHGIFLDEEAIQMMLKNNTYLVPTLAAPYCIVEHADPKFIPEYAIEKARNVLSAHIQSFKDAYKAGVKIAMGTDAGTPFNYHNNSVLELELMVKYGVTPMDAITITTRNSAECLDVLKNYGTIEEGKVADILVVEGNPLDNISSLRNVAAVYKDGNLVA